MESKRALDSGFYALDSGFQALDSDLFLVELGFWIPILSRIPDSLSCIPESRVQDSGFHKQNFPGFWIPNRILLQSNPAKTNDEDEGAINSYRIHGVSILSGLN